MSSEEDSVQTNVKQAVEERAKEMLPALSRAIKSETGKTVPDSVLIDLLVEPMADVATEVTVQATYAYAGPMPSPHVMAGYAQLYPGAPAQLFEQFKAEQTHRHDWENNALSTTSNERRRRDIGAYAIAGLGLGVAVLLAILGAHVVSGLLTGAIVLGGGALVLGRQFLATHTADGTHVSLKPDGSNDHADLRSQKTSSKRKSNSRR